MSSNPLIEGIERRRQGGAKARGPASVPQTSRARRHNEL